MFVLENLSGEAQSSVRLFSIKVYEKGGCLENIIILFSTTQTYKDLWCQDIVSLFSLRFGVVRRSERVGFMTKLSGD